MTLQADLAFLYKEQKELALFGGMGALLGWDQETYMPEAGGAHRAEQLSVLSHFLQTRIVSPKLWNTVRRVKNHRGFAKLPRKDRLVVERLYKDLEKARRTPPSLAAQITHTETLAFEDWKKAREKKSFAVLRPRLEKLFELKRQKAKRMKMKGSVYNGLLDSYEEGMTAEKLEPVFATLEPALLHLARRIRRSKKYRTPKRKIGMSEEGMRAVTRAYTQMVLPQDRTRTDTSIHPFTTSIGPKDTRLTTAYNRDFLFAFGSTIHEAGHALYDANLPQKYAYTVMRDAPSLGIHESQSRLWENMVGKNPAFLRAMLPLVNRHAKSKTPLDAWVFENNRVEPGMIRVEADEVHYALHVIMRFRLERGIIEGKIRVRDLPKQWARYSKKYFGRAPKNDVEGVLQDMHWATGSIGYFPTYILGTIYAAQLYAQAKKDIPGLEGKLAKRNFAPLKKWLHEKVHHFGREKLAEQIVKKATGRGLDPQAYLGYLEDKYAKIYDLQ